MRQTPSNKLKKYSPRCPPQSCSCPRVLAVWLSQSSLESQCESANEGFWSLPWDHDVGWCIWVEWQTRCHKLPSPVAKKKIRTWDTILAQCTQEVLALGNQLCMDLLHGWHDGNNHHSNKWYVVPSYAHEALREYVWWRCGKPADKTCESRSYWNTLLKLNKGIR